MGLTLHRVPHLTSPRLAPPYRALILPFLTPPPRRGSSAASPSSTPAELKALLASSRLPAVQMAAPEFEQLKVALARQEVMLSLH